MKYLLAALLLLFLIAPPAMAARHDTSFSFKTMETAHFSIHYHQGLEEIAKRAAAIAEDAHGTLTAQFRWEPGEKTQMVLIDDTDFTNGYATIFPYNTIYLQVVPPSMTSTLGEYEDWLKVLIVHEYSHVLTMDQSRGYSAVTRRIFGKPLPGYDLLSLSLFVATAPPNVFLPSWWHEGMATWGETTYTGVGRGRSSFYEMILRSAVAEDNLPTIDKINGDVPYWPNGHMPYIFGLRLNKYITDRYGSDALGKLANSLSGRFPYFINGAPSYLFDGKEYPELYMEMLDDLRREQTDRLRILEKQPFTPEKTVSRDGENLLGPRFSPDGSLIAFTRHDPHSHGKVVITERDGKTVKGEFRRQWSDDSLSWSPDGSTLYFAQGEINRGFNVYQDLYSYDLQRDRVKRLTHGLRVKDPDVAPDGRTFAFVITDRGSQNVALLDAADLRATPRLLTAHKELRVESPRWSPDGQRLAYTVTDAAGRSKIHIYTLKTGEITPLPLPLPLPGKTVAFPVWTRDGKTLLYSSDETGVINIFACTLATGETYQLSHLAGGALQPDVAPDGRTIIYSSYTSRGFKIAAMETERDRWSQTRSPAIAPYWKEGRTAAEPSVPMPPRADSPPAAQGYSAWKTLTPRFWLPKVTAEGSKGAVVGAFTAGQDVLGYNAYLMDVGFGTKFQKIYHNVVYQNDYLYPTFTLQSYSQPVLYSDLLQRGDYNELEKGAIIQAEIPINRLESGYSFRLGYHLLDQSTLSPWPGEAAYGQKVFQGRRDNFFAGIDFSNTLKYRYSVSQEEGRNISLAYKNYSKSFNSDLSSSEYLATYKEYLRMPAQHHVLHVSLAGAATSGNPTVQQAFQLGGPPSILNPFSLRGYPSRFESGKYIATGTLEYRAPLFYFLRGINTKPVFFDRLHGAFFTDVGEVWDDQRTFKGSRIKVGIGTEGRFDMTLGYWLKLTPAIGVAYGLNNGGEAQVYFNIYANL